MTHTIFQTPTVSDKFQYHMTYGLLNCSTMLHSEGTEAETVYTLTRLVSGFALSLCKWFHPFNGHHGCQIPLMKIQSIQMAELAGEEGVVTAKVKSSMVPFAH